MAFGDDDIKEGEPYMGTVQISRVSGHVALFDSEAKHQHFIALRINHADRRRSLSQDWIHSKGQVVEVYMTEAQFAATLLGSVYLPSATTSGVGLWAYEDGGSLGATADVVVTDGTLRNSRSVGILTGQGSGISVLDTASEANLSGSIAGDTLNTAGADCLLYVCSTQNGADVSANAPFTDGGATYDENTDDWVTIGWSNDPSGNIESVNLPTGHTSLRAAYVGLALAS